jgi:hypothetical protein
MWCVDNYYPISFSVCCTVMEEGGYNFEAASAELTSK